MGGKGSGRWNEKKPEAPIVIDGERRVVTLPDYSGVSKHTQTLADFDARYNLPAGTITMYGGSSAPTGWVNCDGASLLRAGTYADLFAVIGTTYGSADGTHFNIPDLRGIFPRGVGVNGTLSDANGTGFTGVLGTYQNDKMQGHWHRFYYNTSAASAGHPFPASILGNLQSSNINALASRNIESDTVNGTPRTGTETNPANLGVNFIIKT